MINSKEALPFHLGAENINVSQQIFWYYPNDGTLLVRYGVCPGCCVVRVQATLSQVLSNRGCAQDAALQPLDEEGGKRMEEVWFYAQEKRSPLEKKGRMTDRVF